MRITSPAFEHDGSIPSMYSCDGAGSRPPLSIQEVSDDAKSLALIVVDPDAPMGTFDHWVVWNIPATTKQIEEHELPDGAIEGINSSKQMGWIAPCPPSGIHHYRFQLYALSKPLDVAFGSDRTTVEREMENLIIDRVELVGQYERKPQQGS